MLPPNFKSQYAWEAVSSYYLGLKSIIQLEKGVAEDFAKKYIESFEEPASQIGSAQKLMLQSSIQIQEADFICPDFNKSAL